MVGPSLLLAATLVSGAEAPTSAVLADLDRSGRPQLWVGWSMPSGGRLETWPPGRTVLVPVAPDFLGTGDFDADGKLDLIVAARGDAGVWVLPQGEEGELGPGVRVALAGRVTAALAGDVNRIDGLADLVVAIDSGARAELLVFEDPHGASFAPPEVIALPAPATDLAIALLDDDRFVDVAAGCGSDIVVMHGRDRMLGSGRTDVAAAPIVTSWPAPFAITALAAGRFGSASASPARLAIADRDGHLAVSTPDGAWHQPGDPVRPHAAGVRLIAAKMTSLPGDDLLVVDRSSGSVELYADGVRLIERRAASGRIVTPMRVGPGALEALAIPDRSGVSIVPALSARAAVFIVDDAGDTTDAAPGDGLCATGTGTCTLRAAIEESNAFSGSDTIQFALGAGNPIITPTSPLPAVTEAVTLDGATGGAARVVLNGASAGASANGLVLGPGSNGSAVRALVIRGFGAAGIRVEGSNNVVEGCYLGTSDNGGSGVTGNHDGVVLTGATANGNTIGGTSVAQRNVIANNSVNGVYDTASASPNTIAGNYIGVDATGTVAVPNGSADVRIDETTANAVRVGGSVASPGSPPGNVIGGSIVAGNGDLIQGNLIGFDATGGVALSPGPGSVVIVAVPDVTVGGPTVAERNVLRTVSIGASTGPAALNAKVQGNYIGVDITGSIAIGAGLSPGVNVSDGPVGTLIGGAATSFGVPPGNVISGNASGAGVLVAQGVLRNPTYATVLGNIIGLNAAGTAALPNQRGVHAGSNGRVTLGGENAGEGNLISGNSGEGVYMPGGLVVAKGNRILANGSHGVSMFDGGAGGTPASGTIGGTTAGARNVISGNTLDGIVSGQGSSVTIQGNWIGVGPDGSQPMGNGGAGISFFGSGAPRSVGGSSGLTVGACAGSCNLIANNALDGIMLSGNVQFSIPIRGNVYRSNGDLGIDLDGNGPTLNDPGDGDNGSNHLQNFPVVNSLIFDGVSTTIQGTLGSAANTVYTLDVYANSAKDPSGYGEGEVWLGSTSCTTDASGSCSWILVASGPRDFVAATATSATGETSELSRAFSEDLDGDGILNSADNCVDLANPFQADTDADGLGDLCDNCVSVANLSQTDTDVDGAGDACDCEPVDPTDRRPVEVTGLSVQKDSVDPTLARLSWSTSSQADRYSVARGDLASLSPTEFGSCVAEGALTSFTDSTVPTPGHGFFYLVAGQNFDCGLGSWGKMSNEQERINGDPGACTGLTVANVHAASESTVSGTSTGTLANTLSSDNQYESIQEILSSGGNPANRFSFLEHRWTFSVPGGNKELHAESFHTASTDGDDFAFECSINGTTWVALSGYTPLSDTNVDLWFSAANCAAAGYSGNLMIRIVDTNHTPGSQNLDTVSVDEIFLRVVP